jgi:nicotinate-nucleotide adenylyltransferase
VIDRPGSTHRAAHGLPAAWFERRLLPEFLTQTLPLRPAPALIVLHGPRSPLSSTKLRAQKADLRGSH